MRIFQNLRGIFLFFIFSFLVVINTTRAVFENLFFFNRDLVNIVFVLINFFLLFYVAYRWSDFRHRLFVLALALIVFLWSAFGLYFGDGLNPKALVVGVSSYLLAFVGWYLYLMLKKLKLINNYEFAYFIWFAFLVVAALLEFSGNQLQFILKSDYEGLMTTESGLFRASSGFWTQISAGMFFYVNVIYGYVRYREGEQRIGTLIQVLALLGIFSTVSRLYIYLSVLFYLIIIFNNISVKRFVLFVAVASFFSYFFSYLVMMVDSNPLDLLDILMSRDEGSLSSNKDKIGLYYYVYDYLSSDITRLFHGKGIGEEMVTPWDKKTIGDGAALTILIEFGLLGFFLYFGVLGFATLVSVLKKCSSGLNVYYYILFTVLLSLFVNSSMLDLSVAINVTYILARIQDSNYREMSA